MNGHSLIELAALIPARNINFYFDAYRAMQRVAGGHRVAVSALIDRMRANSSTRVTDDLKLVGHFMLEQFCEEVDKEARVVEKLPEYFFTLAILKDTKLHGQPVTQSFVKRVLNELEEQKIVHSWFRANYIKARVLSEKDMAELFFGFSLAAKGALIPIVPFPAHPAGFVARLNSELSKLLPSGSAFLNWRRRKRSCRTKRA